MLNINVGSPGVRIARWHPPWCRDIKVALPSVRILSLHHLVSEFQGGTPGVEIDIYYWSIGQMKDG